MLHFSMLLITVSHKINTLEVVNRKYLREKKKKWQLNFPRANEAQKIKNNLKRLFKSV